jgi:FkbM family methyltransferase
MEKIDGYPTVKLFDGGSAAGVEQEDLELSGVVGVVRERFGCSEEGNGADEAETKSLWTEEVSISADQGPSAPVSASEDELSPTSTLAVEASTWLRGVLTPLGASLLWDYKNLIPSSDPTQHCVWAQYQCRPNVGACSIHKLPICVHASDAVRDDIVNMGYWGDCNALRKLWRRGGSSKRAIFLELGANIGACVLDMLMHTDAHIVAVEPAPKNLFCLTSTLLKLPEKYRRRVALLPVAAGHKTTHSNIFAAQGNQGHSIDVYRMDKLLNSEVQVAAMQIDVEGYECHALVGMGRLLGSVYGLRVEVCCALLYNATVLLLSACG